MRVRDASLAQLPGAPANETTTGKKCLASTRNEAERCSRQGSLALAMASSAVTVRLGIRTGSESHLGSPFKNHWKILT